MLISLALKWGEQQKKKKIWFGEGSHGSTVITVHGISPDMKEIFINASRPHPGCLWHLCQTHCLRGILAEDTRLFNEMPPMIPYDNCFYLQGFLLPLSILHQLSCSVQLVCTAVSKYWRWSACARHLWKKLHNICFHFLNTSALSSAWCQHGLQN